jgi:hypothetical protein
MAIKTGMAIYKKKKKNIIADVSYIRFEPKRCKKKMMCSIVSPSVPQILHLSMID